MAVFASLLIFLGAAFALYKIGGGKILGACVAILIVVILALKEPAAPPPAQSTPVAAPQATLPVPLETRTKELNQHLSDIRLDPITIEDDRVIYNNALSVFLALSKEHPELKELAGWKKKLEALDKKIKAVEIKKAATKERQERQAQIVTRELYAQLMERRLLDQGMDAYVRATGKDKTTLSVKYVLCSRPLIHQLSNSGDFSESIRKSGFKKFICQTGYGESYWITY